jgi:hypothetical protein
VGFLSLTDSLRPCLVLGIRGDYSVS